MMFLKGWGLIEKFIGLIKIMVSTIQYAVLLNGSPWGNFEVGRGLRQGDPISPHLFIMVVEVLGRTFTKLANTRCVKGIKTTTLAEIEVL